jgi:hypothetical protein
MGKGRPANARQKQNHHQSEYRLFHHAFPPSKKIQKKATKTAQGLPAPSAFMA